jgi:hypothetical protein
MTEICTRGGDRASGLAAGFLALAAAPTFAVMAVLTGAFGSTDMHCSPAMPASPLDGMVVMYLLMSAFHSAPWLKWMARL